MIRKRILISIVALGASLMSFIASADLFPGKVILGMETGISSRSGDLNSNHWAHNNNGFGAPAGTLLGSQIQKLSDTGTIYGLLAGYEMSWREFFASVEGHINWGRYEDTKLSHFRTLVGVQYLSEATYIQGTRVGGTLRFGLNVPPFFKPYLRGGIEYSDHEVAVTNIYPLAPVPPFSWDHYDEKKGLWSWLVGVGVELPIFSDVVGMRLEYDYLPGTTFGFNDFDGPVGASHNIKVRTHVGKLAIVVNLD